MKYDIVLASGSPRRKEILSQVGASFRVVVSDCDETTDCTEPAKMVQILSERKAEAVAELIDGPAVILGADTVVASGQEILGKPGNAERAKQMLHMIEGHRHAVYTGVCIFIKEADQSFRKLAFTEKTEVTVAKMSEREICEYAESGEPNDKAGAYAIQGRFATFIEGMDGDYYNVVGLPIAGIYSRLRDAGIDLRTGESLK